MLQVMCQSHALCSCTHKCQSKTDNLCSACLLVLQVTCQSHALCSCTHKCQSETDNFCSACLLVLQSSQPILLFCCPPFPCLWFPTLRQPWKSPITLTTHATGSATMPPIASCSFVFRVVGFIIDDFFF